jgi:hypothetical protein
MEFYDKAVDRVIHYRSLGRRIIGQFFPLEQADKSFLTGSLCCRVVVSCRSLVPMAGLDGRVPRLYRPSLSGRFIQQGFIVGHTIRLLDARLSPSISHRVSGNVVDSLPVLGDL